MNEVFGLQIHALMVALLIILSVCLLSVAWVAWRRPVIFKLGTRNIPRRKAQTALIVVGLMLSTLIMSAAFGTGDTINYSMTHEIYSNLGPVDELVVASNDPEPTTDLIGAHPLAGGTLARVDAAVASNADVDGVLPLLEAHVPVHNAAAQLAAPDVIVTGLDADRLADFGGLSTATGAAIDLREFGANDIAISQNLADDIEAAVGDTVTLYVNDLPNEFTVAAIAKDSWTSGTRRSRGSDIEYPGAAMNLAAMQTLTGRPGEITTIAISNSGNERAGLDLSDSVTAGLRQELAGTGVGIDTVKDDRVERGERIGTNFTSIFLILGLFSVASGILLIVLIFTMLASERRAEMGMERAIGAHRRQLMQQFVAEGSGYALVAGVVGAACGVGATYGIATGMKAIFGDYLPIEPHISAQSLIVAYCLGVVITFLTIVAASWKVSRINIVTAIRDIPDVSSPKRKLSTLVWSILLMAGGAFMALAGKGNEQITLFSIGLTLLPFGLALFLRFFGAPSRPVFSAVALFILTYWLMPDKQFESIFGTFESGTDKFFTGGILTVIAATVLIAQNNSFILRCINAFGSLFKSKLPAVRTAIAYPGAAVSRTGMTIAMFSLIIFSLVMMATMNQTYSDMALGDEAAAGWDVYAVAQSSAGITDLRSTLEERGMDTSEMTAIGALSNPNAFNSDVRVADRPEETDTDEWKHYVVYGMDASFISHNEMTFQAHADGYTNDAAIIEALATEPNVAVIDSFALDSGDLGGNKDNLIVTDLTPDLKTFEPRLVELSDPDTGTVHAVKIIGVVDQAVSSMWGLYAAQPTIDAIYGEPTQTNFMVALTDSNRADAVAKDIESTLLVDGVEGFSIRDQLKEAQKMSSGFLYIIEGFMGLGLFVGIAAIGVIAFRSVVERRQQIGVLRALGWRHELVSLSFMIETAFIVGLGILTGTGLGLRLSEKMISSGELGSDSVAFVIPWPIILTITLSTFAIALLMTWIPSRQAARIAPAEALRYE